MLTYQRTPLVFGVVQKYRDREGGTVKGRQLRQQLTDAPGVDIPFIGDAVDLAGDRIQTPQHVVALASRGGA